MSIIEIKRLLESLGVEASIYPLAFPVSGTAPVEALMIQAGDSGYSVGDVQEFILTVTARAGHPVKAESLSLDVMDKLHRRTNIMLGDTQIILIRKQNKVPIYAGKDDSGNHYFESDFRVLVD